MKIKELIEYGKNNLIRKDEAYRLSKILLKYFLKVEDSYLVINNEEEIEEKRVELFKLAIRLLNTGTPIQYITNKQEFFELEFYVDENVLIPQPDTEILIEEVLKNIDVNKKNSILDLCTGSGAIGISLASKIDNVEVHLSDISKKALEIAKMNSIKNKVEDKCKYIISDIFENIYSKYNVIVSNPPYIETEVIKTLDKEVQKEPYIALDGGADGLRFYRLIIEEAYMYLRENGILVLEIGYNQKENVIKLLKQLDKYKQICCKKDLAGNDRCIICKLK